jgi:hypothetical protein
MRFGWSVHMSKVRRDAHAQLLLRNNNRDVLGRAPSLPSTLPCPLPKRQLRLVQAWVELHADELDANWERAANEQPLQPIPPLR